MALEEILESVRIIDKQLLSSSFKECFVTDCYLLRPKERLNLCMG